MKKYIIIFLILNALEICKANDFGQYRNYIYDANDFAKEVIAYNPGDGIVRDWLNGTLVNNPSNALGRPTIDTTGEELLMPEEQICPVNPVYSPFRSFELVCLGQEGSLVLKFNCAVVDDDNNPYGVDFIVFGNAQQRTNNLQGWDNGDPCDMLVTTSTILEPAIVSISQDGIVWYSFTTDENFMSGNPNFIKLTAPENDGPFADSFAATLGRVFAPENPDANLGLWNQWWSQPTNPTLPINPLLTFQSLVGKTVAQASQIYGYSAGGTGFDISRVNIPAEPESGLKWFQYVRIDDRPAGGTAEIDAVSDVKGCEECRINFKDYSEFANNWKQGLMDIEGLKNLANNWLGWDWENQ